MKKNWWKYLVPVILALLQIGGSIYNNYFKSEKPKDETTRFEFMIDQTKLTMDGMSSTAMIWELLMLSVSSTV